MQKEFAEPIIHRPVDDSLVLWLTGRGSRREGTLLADLSKKGHHGTLVGSPPWKNTPLGHSVLDFVPNDYIEIADHAELDFDGSTDFSFSFWINTSDTTGGKKIYDKRVGITGVEIFMSLNGNGKIQAFYGDGVDVVYLTEIINTDVADGSWHHIVVVFDVTDDEVRGYLDGSYENNPLDITSITGDISGGGTAYISSSENPFNGKIDDARIYKRLLSAGEPMKIFNQTKHFYGK